MTVIEAGPCVVTQIRNKERDGYEAVQIGFGEVKPKSLTKPEQGHLAGAGRLVRHLREFDADNIEDHQVGQVLSADVFEPGQIIDVTGTSKGRGFQGVVQAPRLQRWPEDPRPERSPSRAGLDWCRHRSWSCLERHAHGRPHGQPRVTVQNLQVVEVLAEKHLLLVRGSVPGAKNGLVMVRRGVKAPQLRVLSYEC